MRLIKNISLLFGLMLAMVACIEETPDYSNFPNKDVDFTYNVDGGQFELDFYVVSTIQFNNVSVKTGAVTWDFGDGNVSTDPNPKHKYAKAGRYNVKLTVEGAGSRTYPILIYDIVPILSVAKQSADIVIINDVTVEMSIFLPNPENLKCQYTWTFPEGTLNAEGEEITTFEGESLPDGTITYPGELRFKHIGSQKIVISTIFDKGGPGERVLEESYANVQVGSSYPCKTIYYAVLDGNIMAYKLVDQALLPEGTKVFPYDMGVKSGVTPMQLIAKNVEGSDFVYILDAGKQYIYINDENNVNGDGKISVMSADGKVTNVMITNVGQQAFNDPYQACADNEFLYYTDRNTGVRKLSLKARGEVEKSNAKTEAGYMVVNQQLGYYNQGLAYGSINADLFVDSKGVFYWSKCYNGYGIFRFTPSDIGQLAKVPHPILFSGMSLRSINIDEKNHILYSWRTSESGAGLYAHKLPALDGELNAAADQLAFVAMNADPINKASGEGLFVTQLALDSDNGKVYFGFNKVATEVKYTTGLKVYNPATKTVENLNDNKDKILGITICDTPSKLFSVPAADKE